MRGRRTEKKITPQVRVRTRDSLRSQPYGRLSEPSRVCVTASSTNNEREDERDGDRLIDRWIEK